MDRGLRRAADGGVTFPADGGLTWAANRSGHGLGRAVDGSSGLRIGMDLGAGLGRRGADFSCWRPTYGFVETQGNVGGRSHWPGMWRVPAWGELEWPCSSQEGLDDYGSYVLLLPNQNHLNREPN